MRISSLVVSRLTKCVNDVALTPFHSPSLLIKSVDGIVLTPFHSLLLLNTL